MELMEHMLEKQSLDQYFSRKLEADLLDSTFFDQTKTSLKRINRETFFLHMILGSILSFPFTDLYGKLKIDRTYLACDFENLWVKLFFVKKDQNLIYRSFGLRDEIVEISEAEFQEIERKLRISGLKTSNMVFENAKHYAIIRPNEGQTYLVNKNAKLRDLSILTNIHVKSSDISPTIINEISVEHLGRWHENLNYHAKEPNREIFSTITPKDLEITSIDMNFESLDQVCGKIARIYQFYDKNIFDNKLSSSRVDHSAFVHGSLLLNFKEKYNLQLWLQNDVFRYHDKATIIMQTPLYSYPIMIDFKDQGSMNNVVKLAAEKAVENGIALPNHMRIKAQKITYAAVNLIAKESVRIVRVSRQQQNFENLITPIIDSVLPLYDNTFPNSPETLKDRILSAEDTILKNIESIMPFSALRDISDHRFLSRYILGQVGSKVSKFKAYTTRRNLETHNVHDFDDTIMTTLIFPTKFEKLDIHVNIYERDSPESDWENFHSVLDRNQPPRTTQKVEHVIRINIKINAKSRIDDFEPLDDSKIQDFFETKINIEGDRFDLTKFDALELRLDPIVKVPDFLALAARSKFSVYEMSLFFHAMKDRIETDSEFQAVLRGLFDGCLQKYNSVDMFFDRSGGYHLILPRENNPNEKVLLTFFMTNEGTPSYDDIVLDEHRTFREETSGLENTLFIIFNKNSQNAEKTLSAVSYETYSRIQRSRIRKNRCTVSRRKRNELCDLVQETLSRTLPEKFKYSGTLFRRIAEMSKIAEISNQGLIAESLLADVINGEIKGLCLNAGFLSGGVALNMLAGKMTIWGSKMHVLGKSSILSDSLRVSSPFVRRLTSGLILYDLINSFQEYKTNGNDIAKANLIADSSFLILDTVEIGIEVAESLGAIAELSSITGPAGMALGAAILIGSDVYRSVKIIDHIDSTLHLSWSEKLKLGLLTFLHINIEERIQDISRKRLETEIAAEISKNLMSHADIFQYIGPTNLHNQVYLNTTFESDMFYNYPYDPSREQLSCLPLSKSRASSKVQRLSYCENSIGMRKLKFNESNDVTLINLGAGNDTAYGMTNSPNLFIIGDGHKFVTGGKKNDTFVLVGEKVAGILDGDSGYNTLDLRHFQSSILDTNVIKNFQHMIGRDNLEDYFICPTDLRQIKTNGGKSFNKTDTIVIERDHQTMKLVINNHTVVYNKANSGIFLYVIEGISNVKIYLTEHSPRHVFLLKDTKSFKVDENGLDFTLVNGSCESCEFRFKDGLVIAKNLHYIGLIKSKDSILNLMRKYRKVSDELQIPITAFSTTDNATLMITHKAHDQRIVVVQNDPHYETHILLNSGTNIIVLNFSCTSRVVLHKANNSSDTLDTRHIYNETVHHKVKQTSYYNWIITFYNENRDKRTFHSMGKVILRNFTLDDLKQDFVMLGAVPMKLTSQNAEFIFQPEPLTFKANESKIIITESDVDYDQNIILEQPIAKISVFKTRTNDLIISDTIFRLQKYSEFAIIVILKRFYSCQKMRTLKLIFEDKEIYLNSTEFDYENVSNFSMIHVHYFET